MQQNCPEMVDFLHFLFSSLNLSKIFNVFNELNYESLQRQLNWLFGRLCEGMNAVC